MSRIVACIAILLSCACDGHGDGADGGLFGDSSSFVDPFGDAALATRTRALFAQTCSGGPESGCHSDHAANFTATLDPDGGDVINVPSTEMPGVVRVEPYRPDQSYLYWKVSGDPRIDGGTMPKSTGYDPRIDSLINAWIEAGAP
jgi:hypothetical protein